MQPIDLDDPSAPRYLKALIYGANGTGKTGMVVSAPNVLVLLNEAQALENIRLHATRLARAPYKVLVMTEIEDYRRVARALRADRSRPFRVVGDGGAVVYENPTWPETVAIDGLTEVCEQMKEEIRKVSPPRIGRDGLPVDGDRYWTAFEERMCTLVRSFRDIPLHVIFTALLDDRIEGEGERKQRKFGPAIAMRRLPAFVASTVNVVGITYRNERADGPPTYGVATQGPSWMLTKPMPPIIASRDVMDFSAWASRFRTRTESPHALEAPDLDGAMSFYGAAQPPPVAAQPPPAQPPASAEVR